MTWFAVYRLADGTLASEGSSVTDAATLASKGLGKKDYAERPLGLDWNPATLDYDIAIQELEQAYTQGEFKQLFTLEEHSAMMGVARTDDMTTAFLDRLNSFATVHISEPDVQAGLQHLVTMGVLTPARAAEIGLIS